MLQENIISINELAGILGHSTPKVTLQDYASVIEIEKSTLPLNFSLYGDSWHKSGTVTKSEVEKSLEIRAS